MTGAERGQLGFCSLLWWGLAQGTPGKCVYFGESMGAGMRGSLSQPDHQAALQEAVQAQRLRATLRFRTKRLRKKPTGHCLGMLYLGPCPRTNFGQGQGKAGVWRGSPAQGRQKAAFVQLSRVTLLSHCPHVLLFPLAHDSPP